jgi:hypothetical protein
MQIEPAPMVIVTDVAVTLFLFSTGCRSQAAEFLYQARLFLDLE